jgi:hypothetical protein
MTKTSANLRRVIVDFNDPYLDAELLGWFESDDRPAGEGDEVIACHLDDGTRARARVTRVDRGKRSVLLRVDPDSFFQEGDPPPPAAAQA